MPAWGVLAVKIVTGIIVLVLLIGGGIYIALNRANTAVEGRVENREVIDRNSERIERNNKKLTGLLGCLQRSRNPQACIDRVVGPRGPGGSSGTTGAMGRRGAQGRPGVGTIGPRGRMGPRGPRGRPGKPGRDGKDAVQPANGLDGIDGVDGTPGLRGLPGPAPTDEQVQAAVNNYCDAHANCSPQHPVPDIPVVPSTP